jgi:hypothetical protein
MSEKTTAVRENGDRTKRKKVTCPRCKGKGFKLLIVGPMLLGGQATPGGKAPFDCRLCCASGKVSPAMAKHYRENLANQDA